jgi:peptide methionine sulfoxide reductase MsrB
MSIHPSQHIVFLRWCRKKTLKRRVLAIPSSWANRPVCSHRMPSRPHRAKPRARIEYLTEHPSVYQIARSKIHLQGRWRDITERHRIEPSANRRQTKFIGSYPIQCAKTMGGSLSAIEAAIHKIPKRCGWQALIAQYDIDYVKRQTKRTTEWAAIENTCKTKATCLGEMFNNLFTGLDAKTTADCLIPQHRHPHKHRIQIHR